MKSQRLTLSYQGLNAFPRHLISDQLQELDLTGNSISDFTFLLDLPQLNTLVIDRNCLTSHTQFPDSKQLRILWANHNNIDNLGMFMANISRSFPSLTHLSLMNNAAAPSYFNGGTVAEYRDYRCYVISQLPKLTFLDDAPVTEHERLNAQQTYARVKRRK